MKTLVYGQDERIAKFCMERIKGITSFGLFTTLGIERDGELIAGVVYNNYSGNDICGHIAAVSGSKWCDEHVMRAICSYPLVQLGCNRVTCLIPTRNQRSFELCKYFGFKQEGLMRKAFVDDDGILMGILKEECPWIGEHNGQECKPADAA